MAATTFYIFPRLPGEIRNMVWDEASNARPTDSGGVHRFSLFFTTNVPDDFKNHTVDPRDQLYTMALGPPSAPGAENPDPWSDPQSTYAIDAGLWSACRESCAGMLRRHKGRPSSKTLRVKDGSDGGKRYITIDEERDLVLLELGNMEFESPIRRPSYTWTTSSRLWPLDGIAHIAVDFDPSWSVQGFDDAVQGGDGHLDGRPAHEKTFVPLYLAWRWCVAMGDRLWIVDRNGKRGLPSMNGPIDVANRFSGGGRGYSSTTGPDWAQLLMHYVLHTSDRTAYMFVRKFSMRSIGLSHVSGRPVRFGVLVCDEHD